MGELVTELRARLGFVAQGPSSNYNKQVMVSFLQEGNDYIAEELGPLTSRKKTIITLEPGSFLYDWHNDIEDEDINPGTVISIWLNRTETDRQQMRQGITEWDRSQTDRGQPCKYDTLNGQIEVLPVPDQPYNMLVEYIGSKPRFTQDSDRTAVPDRLVLLYALAVAKAHYSRPDAQAALSSFNRMMTIEKSRQHENRRYIIPTQPVNKTGAVVGSDGSYVFYPES